MTWEQAFQEATPTPEPAPEPAVIAWAAWFDILSEKLLAARGKHPLHWDRDLFDDSVR